MTLLLLVDYYFWYIEVIKTPITTSAGVINGFKSIFARHGVPEVLITDNGPQFYSGTFSSFAMDYDFRHVTSSPYFAQSNGEALAEPIQGSVGLHRVTPLHHGPSPAELLMGRSAWNRSWDSDCDVFMSKNGFSKKEKSRAGLDFAH